MNGSSASGGGNFPYAYNPTYDAFNNVVSSSYLYRQSGNTNVTFSATYQNNRVVTASDAGQAQTWNYDSMGNRTSLVQNSTTVESVLVNALGRAVNSPVDGEGQSIGVASDYYVRSTVLGGAIVTQLDYAGVKNKGRVLDGNNLLAEQLVSPSGNFVQWHHRDPLNLVARDTQPGQIKRKTFAINPVGAQIESTEGVNISQYYACLYGGPNNPTCTGTTPQPPGGGAYGSTANAANGEFAAGLKVDGVLTLQNLADALAQIRRTGNGDVYISPSLSGTALGGSFIRHTNYDLISTPNIYTENGELLSRGQRILDISDSILWVPGGEAPGNQQTVNQSKKPQNASKAKDKQVPDSAGRLCLEENQAPVFIRNRHSKFVGGPIPHTWIKLPDWEVGWGPIKAGPEGPGYVEDNSNRRKYPIDYELKYTACPHTLHLMYKAIDENRTGNYVYNNRPKAYTDTIIRGSKEVFWTETKFYPAGYNCVGWAMMVLERAGIKPPVASSTPNIIPLTPK